MKSGCRQSTLSPPSPKEARVRELSLGSTCARPGAAPALRECGGAGLGQARVTRTSPPQTKGPRSSLRAAHACLPWQPQLRESVALCGRGLPAPRRAAGTTRAGSRWLRPPSQPIRGRRQLPPSPGGADPPAHGHRGQDHPQSPALSPDPPSHARAGGGAVTPFPAPPTAASASAHGAGARI